MREVAIAYQDDAANEAHWFRWRSHRDPAGALIGLCPLTEAVIGEIGAGARFLKASVYVRPDKGRRPSITIAVRDRVSAPLAGSVVDAVFNRIKQWENAS